MDDDGQPLAVPEAVLWRGLVYPHGTVSPMLGCVEEYDELRSEHDLPSHQEDRAAQPDTLAAAEDDVAWIYDLD